MSSGELSRVDSGFYISNCDNLGQRAKERKGVLGACELLVSTDPLHFEIATRSHIVRWGQLCASADRLCVPLQHCFGSADTE